MRQKVNLHCSKCWYKTVRKINVFQTAVPVCPRCNVKLKRKVRIECEHEGCSRFTIVEGDPTFNNYNFYSRKYDKTVDMRNVGFVCSDHEEEFDKERENDSTA